MPRVPPCIPALLITMMLIACHDATAPPSRGASTLPMLSRERTVTTAMPRLVAPSTIDPRINWQSTVNPDAPHYVWLDRTVPSNHQLLLFLPAGNTPPARYAGIGAVAARLGYHVIVLMYPNEAKLVDANVCGGKRDTPQDPAASTCYENARLEILDGNDRVSSPLVDVDVFNSIDYRVTTLLRYLHHTAPEEGWGAYLHDGAPKWRRIAVAGHSQGGGEAAMIAKLRVVPRVVLFSAVPDTVQTKAPLWLAGSVTPSDRYYALAHTCDAFFGGIADGWDLIGMSASIKSSVKPNQTKGAFCREVIAASDAVRWAEKPPYDGAHILITSLLPLTGDYLHKSSHHSTANDDFAPPMLSGVWSYLLTATLRPTIADEDDEDTDAGAGP
jgi:hypothetical protein